MQYKYFLIKNGSKIVHVQKISKNIKYYCYIHIVTILRSLVIEFQFCACGMMYFRLNFHWIIL